MIKTVLTIVVALAVVAFLFFAYKSFSAQKDVPKLGIVQGSLTPCPDKPNCVSTFAPEGDHHMEAWALKESPADVLAKIKAYGEGLQAQVILETPNYIHLVFRSAIFRYPDDVEIFVDETQGKIHFRSASRVGHSDLGANRKRMLSIKEFIEPEA